MTIEIQPYEYSLSAIRSSGPGGQHVNKVSTGIALSFDIQASSLSDENKLKLLSHNDHRITNSGVIKITATNFRSQAKNKTEAIKKLHELIQIVTKKKKKRKRTSVPKAVKEARLNNKARKSDIKKSRQKPIY